MAKLSDKKKKQIIADAVDGMSIRALADKYKVSTTTIQRIKKSDTNFTQKVTQKKEENTKSILSHMETKADLVCEIIDGYLSELANPERLETSSTREIATALGIILDKFIKTDKGDDMSKLDDVLKKIGGKI